MVKYPLKRNKGSISTYTKLPQSGSAGKIFESIYFTDTPPPAFLGPIYNGVRTAEQVYLGSNGYGLGSIFFEGAIYLGAKGLFIAY